MNHLFFVALFVTIISHAQLTNHWYFGSAAGFPNTGLKLDFSSGSPIVSTGFPMRTEEGTSSIADENGNPLFYTDGINLYDASTNLVFSTYDLGGNSSTTQSAIIIPKPGTTNEWLVFTKGVNNGPAFYVTVRRTGSVFSVVEPARVSLVANAEVGEGMYIVGNTKPGGAYWVIFRDVSNTGVVRAYEVTNTGTVITTPVTSTLSGASFTNTNYVDYLGIIKANSCQDKLAFTYFNGDADIVDFNPSTGQVVANTARRIVLGGNSYGIEFSPNDEYLYLTTLTNGRLFQYNIGTNTLTTTATLSGGNEAGQLQLGPDGRIYMAIRKVTNTTTPPSYLGIITNPNAASPGFIENGLLLTGVTNSAGNTGFSYRGLPTFPRSLTVSSLFVTPTDTTICVNSVVNLKYVFGGFASSNSWQISPGSAGTQWQYTTGNASAASPTVRFLQTGTYKVKLTVTDNCGFQRVDSLFVTVNNPLNPAGTVACHDGKLILDNPANDPNEPNYVWYRNSVSSSNVIGIGTPLEYFAGRNDTYKPSQICVGVGSSVSNVSSLNRTIGQTAKPTSAANGDPVVSPTFDVLADLIVLKSYRISFWVCPAGGNVTVTVRNGANAIIYQTTHTITGCVTNTEYIVPLNISIPKGNGYTITTSGTSAQYYRYAWAGALNANEVSMNASSFPSPYYFEYDAFRYSFSPVCANTQCYPVTCSLPLEFVSIKWENSTGRPTLVWQTTKETNLEKMVVQSSDNGLDFKDIASIPPKNNILINHYSYPLEQFNPNGYYRIAAFDYGNSEPIYSAVVSLENQPNNLFSILSKSESTLTIKASQALKLQIFDLKGSLVKNYTLVAGENPIEIVGLGKGLYVIKGKSDYVESTVKWSNL